MFRRRRVALDVDASRLYRRGRDASASSDEREFSINCQLGGFGVVGIAWLGTSEEDVRNSFLEYLSNHDEFAELSDSNLRTFRSLYVRFHGQRRLLTFRTDWITGFTVH